MAKEIERKFLVKATPGGRLASGTMYRQGYLNSVKERTVRIRTVGDKAFLTIKGITVGATRVEYEYQIPFDDCNAMLDSLAEKPIIEKTRYKIPIRRPDLGSRRVLRRQQGLIVAEVELTSEDQKFDKPAWIGEEVSGDPRYFNSNLIKHPYTKWTK